MCRHRCSHAKTVFMRIRFFLLIMVAFVFMEALAQQGEKSLSAALVVAPSDDRVSVGLQNFAVSTGLGIEVAGLSHVSHNGAIVLQAGVTRFRCSSTFTNFLRLPVVTPIYVKGGYRYRFTESGFFVNALTGLEYWDKKVYLPLTAGVGKRFFLNADRFIDAGIDFTSGTLNRINVKAAVSFLRNY